MASGGVRGDRPRSSWKSPKAPPARLDRAAVASAPDDTTLKGQVHSVFALVYRPPW